MKLYANLHTHSTHSDGAYSPEEMVKVAKNEGYKAIAITDHDTATAYPELVKACEKEGMECIFGVEFSVSEPMGFHIVGFHFDPEYSKMKEYLAQRSQATTYANFKCFEEAVENGNIQGITWDEVLEYNKGITWISNNHVFRAMKAKGLVEESQYMDWFRLNFWKQRGKYRDGNTFLPLSEMINLIKEAGGIAICAHPGTEKLDNFDLLMQCGIDGLEVWHPDLSKEEQERAYKLCIENNLFISGGSDHSGLCSGLYSAYSSREALEQSSCYIEPLSSGTTEQYFREIQTRKILR